MMNFKSLALAFAAGITTFLVVGIVVTELAQPSIEFSLFLGIPAGLGAGAFVTAIVYRSLADDAPAERRRIAFAVATFGLVFLLVLVAVATLLDLGTVVSLIVAAVVGILASVSAYLGGGPSDGYQPSQ